MNKVKSSFMNHSVSSVFGNLTKVSKCNELNTCDFSPIMNLGHYDVNYLHILVVKIVFQINIEYSLVNNFNLFIALFY